MFLTKYSVTEIRISKYKSLLVLPIYKLIFIDLKWKMLSNYTPRRNIFEVLQ